MKTIKNIITEEIQNLYEANDIGGSLWGLIKYTGGYFKSEKQRDFFLGKLERQNRAAERAGYGSTNALMSGGEVYGNSYTNFFYMDNEGVTKVVKHTRAGGDKVTWERSAENTAKALSGALNTDFHKAMRKYIDGYNEQYKQIQADAVNKAKQIHQDASERDWNTVVTYARKGELKRQVDAMKNEPRIAELPFIKASIYLGEVLQKMIDDGIAQADGRPWGNFHPEFHNVEKSGANYGENFGKLLPQWQTPEAKQEFIDKMASE